MEKDRVETIRENISKAIVLSKLSRLKVTELAGISYPNLTRFLNRSRQGGIGIDVLFKLSKVLNVPVSHFLGDSDKNGYPLFSVEGKTLSGEWDIVMKRIVSTNERDRQKVLKILKSVVEVISCKTF